MKQRKEKLLKILRFIKNNIDAKQLIDHFIEEGIFSMTTAQEFFSNTETMENRNNNFLILLMRSSPRAYDVFIQALEKNECGFVAEKIKNTHVDKSECMMEEDARRPRPVPAVRQSIQARKEMEDAKNVISSLESENKKMKNEMESVQRDRDIAICSLQSEMESVQRDRDIAISSLRSEMESVQMDKDNAISSLESEKKKMKNEMESVQRDKDNAICSLQSEMKSVQRDRDIAICSIETENKKMKNEMESVQRDRDNAISSLQSEMQSVQRDKDNAISSLESENKKMKNEMESVQRDRDKLSKIMVSKRIENNPSISDLSDDHRALKLAEKYSELYENQWTEAIDKLKYEGTAEDTSLDVLLHIAKKSFNFCKRRADEQMSQLEKLLHSPGSRQTTQLTKEKIKLLKYCRKAAAADAAESMCEEVAYDLSKILRGQYTT